MSERGSFRGRGGGGAARGDHRGGRSGGRGGSQSSQAEKPKKENILDLTKYMDKQITVKFTGGREGKMIENSALVKMHAHTVIVYSGRYA